MIKNKLFQSIVCLFLITASSQCIRAQQIDSLLNILDTRYPQEKIHLHVDKAFYNAGETIWFKAYLTADNLPAAISKTMYAELLDDKGNLLQRKTMPVILSGGEGNFDLPDTVAASRLFIRAYTSWTLNFDSSLLYLKSIQIIPAKTALKKTPPALTYSVQFFPEGGDLVNDISSRVAFKANDSRGEPFVVKGDVMDSKNKKVASFSSVHDGMGYFLLQPAADEKYRAIWKDKKGMQHETVLPEAKKQGIVLSTRLEGNRLEYTLTRPAIVDDINTSYYVVAQMQQRLMYSARINMTKKTTVTAPPIETDSLPNGVLQFTVFNALRIPVAERVVFINNDSYSFITDLHSGDKNLGKRGRNTLQIDVGGTVLSNLSISVTDAGLNPVTKNEESIYSQLLLSSDLKGYIYNPAWYFSATQDSVKEYLDLVMMTNGWRRFKWENVLAGKWPVIKNLPESYLSVSGKILGISKALLHGKQLTGILKTKNGGSNIFMMPISSEGEFVQDGLVFFDTAKLHYQINADKDKTLTTSASFSFRNSFIRPPAQSTAMLAALYAPERTDSSVVQKSSTMAALQRNQVENNRMKTLETVQVRTKQKSLKEKLDEEYASGFFKGGDGYTFTTEDDPFAKSAMSILQYLQGKVPGLQISTTGEGGATWRGSSTSFFLNEMTTDVGNLQSINMNDVAMIKVFRPPFFGAMGGGAGGAIAIYTKKGGNDNSQVKGLPLTLVNGYSVVKEFYSPDYEKNPEPDVRDYRTTLYWKANLYFDKNSRRVTIPFFNSDNGKKIRVTIEGINEAGQLTREEKIIE